MKHEVNFELFSIDFNPYFNGVVGIASKNPMN
jgi:hypothetical protein